MAMILELDVPKEEVERITAFLTGDTEEIPVGLSEPGANVLDGLSKGQENGLWRYAIGRFVEYKKEFDRSYVTPDGTRVKYADALCDDEGSLTGKWGKVHTDTETPEAAYLIGVPL